MNQIERLDWIKSAIIIDDKWDEVKDLNHQLTANGVATIYVNPGPPTDNKYVLQSFPNDELRNFGLVFLDIELGHGLPFNEQVNFVVGSLEDWISPQCGPYGVVVWSREEGVPNSEGKDALQYIKDAFNGYDKPKPLFIVDLDKHAFINTPDLYKELTLKLKQKLSTNRLAQFFSLWQGGVLDSTAESYKFIRDCAETLTTEVGQDIEYNFFDIVKHATVKHFGFPSKASPGFEKTLSRYSFCYISHILFDKLNAQFSSSGAENVFGDCTDNVQEILYTRKNMFADLREYMQKIFKGNGHGLNKKSLKDLGRKIELINGKIHKHIGVYDDVIAKLNFIEVFDDIEGADVDGQPGVIYRNGESNSLLINITPPCDYANNKGKETCLVGSMSLLAELCKARNKDAENRKWGMKFFPTPPAFFKDKYLVMKFDLTRMEKDKAKEFKPFLRLKESTFNDLMQKFGYHNSRLGARNL